MARFRKSRRILPIHGARVQPPRKRDFPYWRTGLRGNAAMTSFTLSRARERVTFNFRSAGWRN
jgi:hypothetical protein